MSNLVIVGKIELPIVKDIICPSCGKNCNREGLRVDYKGILQPCDDCLEEEQFEYWEQLAEQDNCAKNIFDGTPDWLRME